MTTTNPEELQELVVSLWHAQIVNYVNVASGVLLTYDFLLTFPDEVRLVWPSPWNLAKWMYFLARYSAFVDTPINLIIILLPGLDSKYCDPLNKAGSWLGLVGIAIAEIVLAMRTYALFGQSKWMLIFLLLLLGAAYIPAIALMQIALVSLSYLPVSPFPPIAPCVPVSGSRIIYVAFILNEVFELTIVSLTAWRRYSQWNENSPLINTLFEDGMMYFVYLAVISLANVIILSIAPFDFAYLLLIFQRVLHAMLSSRMLLNIRNVVSDRTDNENLTSVSFATATKPSLCSIGCVQLVGDNPESLHIHHHVSDDPFGTTRTLRPQETYTDNIELRNLRKPTATELFSGV